MTPPKYSSGYALADTISIDPAAAQGAVEVRPILDQG
jgi:hypothetical protein